MSEEKIKCIQCGNNYPVEGSAICFSCGLDTIEDIVAHPNHYTSHPSGIECLQITEHMNFCLGNALKYIWRCDMKMKPIEDLKKAIFYIEREIERREK